jgi:hypothetical protein
VLTAELSPVRVPFLSEHSLPAKARREVWVDDKGGKKPEVQPANPSAPGSAPAAGSSADAGVVGGMAGSFPGGGRVLCVLCPSPVEHGIYQRD